MIASRVPGLLLRQAATCVFRSSASHSPARCPACPRPALQTPPVPRAEQQDMTASDDEWEHMSRPQKWWMEAKALLYSWLRTGVEPL